MKVKFVWFDVSDPALMSVCFQKWCARQMGSPGSVKTSVLSLWKSGAIALILPAYAFDHAQSVKLSRSPGDPPPPPPPSNLDLFP